MPSVGLILTTFNDMPEAGEAYNSLILTHAEYPFDLVVVDAGSSDDTVDFFCASQAERVIQQECHLSEALNLGIDHFIGRGVNYIGWVHPDMEFPQTDWLRIMVTILAGDRSIGKLGADSLGRCGEDLRSGNTCPWVCPTKTLGALRDRDGFCFDEQFVFCGGYEDWDLNRRIIQAGQSVLITSQAQIQHESMVSRNKPREGVSDYHNAGRINAEKYTEKWGDCDPPV